MSIEVRGSRVDEAETAFEVRCFSSECSEPVEGNGQRNQPKLLLSYSDGANFSQAYREALLHLEATSSSSHYIIVGKVSLAPLKRFLSPPTPA